ncbi:unnamed protein product [Paramecium pentaurelia]|uniref:Uncharacterized protein n=1 Tax=Paramecium pentaurelia TaxID=43138 RepID=A0A8S1UV12_9CILI|nr:unnamed protein product [Paramecium pentaurelia]
MISIKKIFILWEVRDLKIFKYDKKMYLVEDTQQEGLKDSKYQRGEINFCIKKKSFITEKQKQKSQKSLDLLLQISVQYLQTSKYNQQYLIIQFLSGERSQDEGIDNNKIGKGIEIYDIGYFKQQDLNTNRHFKTKIQATFINVFKKINYCFYSFQYYYFILNIIMINGFSLMKQIYILQKLIRELEEKQQNNSQISLLSISVENIYIYK